MTFTAINKRTNRIVHASSVFKDTSYILPENDVWYINPELVENYNEVLNNNNLDFIEARYKNGHDRKYDNNKVAAISPHFFVPNKDKLGINLINETKEHKAIKQFIFQEIINNPLLKINYSTYKDKSKDIKIKNYICFQELDEYINWSSYRDTTQGDFFEEVSITDLHNTRRVDVLLPFKKKHILFGDGINIEVQLSKQTQEDKKKRTIERALKGYSTIWIEQTHFEDIKTLNLQLVEDIFINAWHSVLHYNSKKIVSNIYEKIQRYSFELDEKFAEIEEKYKHLTVAGMLCPQCKIGILSIKKGQYGAFLGCSNYPKCNNTYKLSVAENE